MKNEFVLAFNEVLEEKQLPKDTILEALRTAMVSAYRRAVNASNAQHIDATIDPETGKVTIYAEKEVVEQVEDERTEVSLEEARRVDPNAQLGSVVIVESTPRNFGRVAAQTARQVVQQKIREAEREAQFNYFTKQLGEIVSGVVQAQNAQGVTLGMEMKAEGVMPRNHMVPGERFRLHDRIRALLLEVKSTPRGPQIILSRAHRNFLRRLLENEVPEIYHGMVEIRSIAREPGQRSKVAVAALQPGVDPVGACVGIRGVRIQAIVRELNDEKIDVIEWSPDPAVYIAKALSPARVSGVYLNEQSKGAKTATVVVPEDQLSLAIGRDGQNARLAAKLTSWRIDIKSLPEAAVDALDKLANDPDYAAIAENEADIVPQVQAILNKKAEGRPVTPEEYQLLTQFVDRVERGLIRQRQSEARLEEERLRIEHANVPQAAFEIPLEKFDVSERVYAVISEAGFQTVGDLMLQMRLDPDSIWKLNGMGPKAMKELTEALDRLVFEEEITPEPAAVPEESLVAEMPSAEVAAPAEVVETVEFEEVEQPAPEAEAETTQIEETAVAPLAEVIAEEQPVTTPIEDLFTLRPEIFQEVPLEDEEAEEEETGRRKKKSKKKKYVELTYDPDQDVTVMRKKHKRGGAEWDEEW